MILWWIGNVILLLVVLPVVLWLLGRLLTAVERVRTAVDGILANGAVLLRTLDNVPALLAKTDDTIKQVTVGATRYAGSVAKLLG